MTGVNTKIKFTYKDYKNLPESETKRYELIEGELIMVPSPVTYHQRISRRLEFLLEDFVRKNRSGEIFYAPYDVHLGDNVVQPDILFVSKEHSYVIITEEIKGAPDLVIEILSPATAERDRTIKRALYARYGVREYWIVDPEEKTIQVLTLKKEGYETSGIYKMQDTLNSPLLSGLSINLNEIF
ncbi:MAG: Uma2 family endonuclease [Candidatus Aerophobetes bacterium]|nr:Uma2 family endonuclease [Candidatus Aerophobetes bacterium]